MTEIILCLMAKPIEDWNNDVSSSHIMYKEIGELL